MAIAVCPPVATCFEMNRVFKLPGAIRIGRRIIASLVGTFVDLKFLPAILEHLGHKYHSVQSTLSVEGPENFLFASDLYPIADAQFSLRIHTLGLTLTAALLRPTKNIVTPNRFAGATGTNGKSLVKVGRQ